MIIIIIISSVLVFHLGLGGGWLLESFKTSYPVYYNKHLIFCDGFLLPCSGNLILSAMPITSSVSECECSILPGMVSFERFLFQIFLL